MLGDLLLSSSRARGIEFSNARGELPHIIAVKFGASFTLALFASLSAFLISQTFTFCLINRALFNQQPLPLVLLAKPTPLQDNC